MFSERTFWAVDDSHRRGRLVAFGRSPGPPVRHLIVVCDTPLADGSTYPISARPMSPRERRDYERRLDDEQG